MVVLLGTFLFNLFCGLFPCDPNFGIPEIKENPVMTAESRSGGVFETYLTNVEPRVVVREGMIEGYRMKTIGGRNIFAFEGIPYGQPPVGKRRFKPPVARVGWKGTLKAHKPGPDCLQYSLAKMLRVYGSEDCLYLNVFTPNLNDEVKKLPVIFYMHGGSFFMGTGSEHGPSYLLDRNVVLVTINYRLGVLGFMSTGDSALPGNYGLKDQALALNWVYDNIEEFGGNRENINLWGHSAGAASTHLHMISNKTRHLFKKGVSISGTALNHWAVIPKARARSWTQRMAKQFFCPTHNNQAMANCLKEIPSIQLVAAQLKLFDWFPFPPTMFAPTVEEESEDAFLTEMPEDAYKLGHVSKKPWVATVTSNEGLTAVLVLNLLLKYGALKTYWRDVAPFYMDLAYILPDKSDVIDKVTEFYLKGKSIRQASKYEISDMLTDRFFLFGIRKGIEAHASIAPTYSYYFSFRQGKHNMANFLALSSPEWGPGHAEDDYYFFNCTTQYAAFQQSDIEYEMSKIMINLLTNFVTNGEPSYDGNGKGGRLLINDEYVWDAVTNISDIRMLQMDSEIKMIQMPRMDKLRFWENLHLPDMLPWNKM